MIPAVMPTYNRTDTTFERGEGAWLIDAEGRRFLDFAAGIAVCSLGHCHPHLVATLQSQATRLWHTSNLFPIAEQQRLADRLVAATFADTAFFTNSGVEAWECGVKVARKYQSAIGHPERWRVITVGGAFHGRTLAAIAAGRSEKLVGGFGPIVDGFDQVAWGNLNELRAAVSDETAAICVEPILGEGGIRALDDAYMAGLRATADEFGLLLLFDEIQTGFGRTGRLFAHEWTDVRPDLMCVAKGMGGGFPTGALLASERAAIGMVPGTHGSTFGGNPLAMAVANAVLDVMLAPGFLAQVEAMGARFCDGLLALADRHPAAIEDVRGRGLMVGLKVRSPAAEIIAALRADGLLSVPAADNVIRLLPPLIVEAAEIDHALGIIDRVVAAKVPVDA